MPLALIALGSNLGDRGSTLDLAVRKLKADPQIASVRESRWHETTPVGGPADQGTFFNGAALLETALSPRALLEVLRRVERELGRERKERWAARTIDLDLLLYDDVTLDEQELEIPHPRMSFRRFVLEPAVEVASEFLHPTIGWTLGRLLEHLNGAKNYVSIAGAIASGKTLLAKKLAPSLGATLVQESLSGVDLGRFYADPSSLGWETELRFLQQRIEQLDRNRWQHTEGPILSDYWFDQSLAFAQVWLPPDQAERFERHWQNVAKQVITPKLLVVLEVSPETLRKRWSSRNRIEEQQLTQEKHFELAANLMRLIAKGGHGPTLRLKNCSLEAAQTEIVAAIEAMQ